MAILKCFLQSAKPKEMMPITVDHLTTSEEKLTFYFPSLNVEHQM